MFHRFKYFEVVVFVCNDCAAFSTKLIHIVMNVPEESVAFPATLLIILLSSMLWSASIIANDVVQIECVLTDLRWIPKFFGPTDQIAKQSLAMM